VIRFDPSDLTLAISSGVLAPEQVAPPSDISESEFTRLLIAVARGLGWRTAHFRPARLKSGRWATPVQGDATGFPDLILVRGKRLLAIELKSRSGRLRPEQRDWLDALGLVPGVTCVVARPGDWPALMELLSSGS